MDLEDRIHELATLGSGLGALEVGLHAVTKVAAIFEDEELATRAQRLQDEYNAMQGYIHDQLIAKVVAGA